MAFFMEPGRQEVWKASAQFSKWIRVAPDTASFTPSAPLTGTANRQRLRFWKAVMDSFTAPRPPGVSGASAPFSNFRKALLVTPLFMILARQMHKRHLPALLPHRMASFTELRSGAEDGSAVQYSS